MGVLNHVLGWVADVWIQNIRPAWVTVDPNHPEAWGQVSRLFKMGRAQDPVQSVRKIRLKALDGADLSSFECDPFCEILDGVGSSAASIHVG
ncbi:MAG: hypothetical protein KatS3mg104_3239 [Phycisphaerae bacterium]|nr:MAG: hypothetical protein KatS3mg104_3239 [Phycisphaerae bacterium]